MNVQIDSIEPAPSTVVQNKLRFNVCFCLGEISLIASITETIDRDLSSFNFDERFFDAIFGQYDLGGRFNRDYWTFRDGQHAPFPWEYGDYDARIVDFAERVFRTSIESLR